MWMMNDKPFDSSMIDESLGFVYIITNLLTGRAYVGKKLFFFTHTKIIKGKKKRIKKESDWKDYWSSNETLKKDVKTFGEENFTREIIHLCPSKGIMSYLEMKEQIIREVLEWPMNWYNGYVGCRSNRNHIKPLWK